LSMDFPYNPFTLETTKMEELFSDFQRIQPMNNRDASSISTHA
jgi:hypothetical protein